jgi:hypothetical protein
VGSNRCRRLLGRRCFGEFELGDGMDGSAGGARGGPLHGEASECGISSARGGSAHPVLGRARQRCKNLSGARSLKRVNSGGAELWVPLGTVGGFVEKEWGERGRVPARRWRIEEGKEKGRGSGRDVGREVKAVPAWEQRCRAGGVHTTRRGERGRGVALAGGPPGEWGPAAEGEKRREGDRWDRLQCHWFKLKQTEPNEFKRI